SAPAAHSALPSFPTRRSSDLGGVHAVFNAPPPVLLLEQADAAGSRTIRVGVAARLPVAVGDVLEAALPHCRHDADDLRITAERRSEEHTSELQSRENIVCRLL